MNHLTIDLQGGTRTVVVDWTHGNEELTDYELGPRGERVYFPSLLDQKCHDGHGKKKNKNKKTTKAAAAAAAAAAARASPSPPPRQATPAFSIASTTSLNLDAQPNSFVPIGDHDEQENQRQEQQEQQRQQLRESGSSPSLLADRLSTGHSASPGGKSRSPSPVSFKLNQAMRTISVQRLPSSKGAARLSGPKWMVALQTIRCFAPLDYFNEDAQRHEDHSTALARETHLVEVDEYNPITRAHVVTLLSSDGRDDDRQHHGKVGAYLRLKLGSTPHAADISHPLTLYQSWQMRFDVDGGHSFGPKKIGGSRELKASKRRHLRDLVWREESLLPGAYYTLVFGDEHQIAAAPRRDDDDAVSDDSATTATTFWTFELPNPWWDEAQQIISNAREEYVHRWNRIHEANKEKRKVHLEGVGKREEAAALAQWKDANPDWTYVRLAEERERAARLAAVRMEQWAAEHPPPTAEELRARDREAAEAAAAAAEAHFVKNLPDAPEVDVLIDAADGSSRVVAAGSVLSLAGEGPLLQVKIEPAEADSLYFEARWNEASKTWIEPPKAITVQRSHPVKFPRERDKQWDDFLENVVEPAVRGRVQMLPPVFAYSRGQRLRDIDDAGSASATIVEYDGAQALPYEVRVDNEEEEGEEKNEKAEGGGKNCNRGFKTTVRVDPTEKNHRPGESYRYERGTQLSVYLDGEWRDVLQKAERSSERSLLVDETIRGDVGSSFDLNQTNHAVRRLDSFDFEEARLKYLHCLARSERYVEDSLTGARLDVRKQVIRLGSVAKSEKACAALAAIPVVEAVQQTFKGSGLLSGMAAQWRNAASKKVIEREGADESVLALSPSSPSSRGPTARSNQREKLGARFNAVSTIDELVKIMLHPSDCRINGHVDSVCVLIRGVPGAGKSWAVSQLAVRMAELALNSDRPEREWVPVVVRSRELARLLRTRLPSEHVPPPRSFNLLYWFLENSPQFSPHPDGMTAHTRQMLLQALESMRLVILIDGLDEIAEDLQKTIENFVREELVPRQIRVAITARPGTWTTEEDKDSKRPPVVARQSYAGYVRSPEGVKPPSYTEKSHFEEKPFVMVVDLVPVNYEQRIAATNQQLPKHAEFFENLEKYDSNRERMDAIYASTCPAGALENVPSRAVPLGTQQKPGEAWNREAEDRYHNVKELVKHAADAKELLHIELTRIIFNLGLSTSFIVSLPLKGQVLEDDSEALWAGQDVADDDSENQQKRLRKLNYLAKKCKTLKIDYAILDRLCESEQRSRRHPESSGAALIFNVVQEMAMFEDESQLEAVFRRIEKGTPALQLVGVNNFFESSQLDLARFRRLELTVAVTLKTGEVHLCSLDLHIGGIYDKASNYACMYFERLMKRSSDEEIEETRRGNTSPVPALLSRRAEVQLHKDMEKRLDEILGFREDRVLLPLLLSTLDDAVRHGRVLPMPKTRAALYQQAAAASVNRVEGLDDRMVNSDQINSNEEGAYARQARSSAITAILRRIAFANQSSRRTYFTWSDLEEAVADGDYDQGGTGIIDDAAQIDDCLRQLRGLTLEGTCALPLIDSVVEATHSCYGLFRFTETSIQDYFAASEMLHRLAATAVAPPSERDYEGVLAIDCASEPDLRNKPSARTKLWDTRDPHTSAATLNDEFFQTMMHFVAEGSTIADESSDAPLSSLSLSASHLTFPNGEYSASGLTQSGFTRMIDLHVRQPCLTSLCLANSQHISRIPPQFEVAGRLLKKLDLSDCVNISGDLTFIRALSALKWLSLSNCKSLDCRNALDQLSTWEPTATHIEYLNLFGTNVEGELTVPIMEWLTQLQYKNFRGCGRLTLPETFASHVSETPHIQSIDLYSLSTIEGTLKSFWGLQSLTSLDLSGCQRISGWLHPLAHLKNLKNLSLRSCLGVSGMCDALAVLTSLESLSLCECQLLTSFEGLECLTNLKTLDLRMTSICSPLNISGGRFRYDLLAADGETVVHSVDVEKNLRVNPDRYRIVHAPANVRPLAPGTRIEKRERTGAKLSSGRSERAWRLNCTVVSHTVDNVLATTEFRHAQCSSGWQEFVGRLVTFPNNPKNMPSSGSNNSTASTAEKADRKLFKHAVVVIRVEMLGKDGAEEIFERIARATWCGAVAVIIATSGQTTGQRFPRRRRRFKIPVIVAPDLPLITDGALVTFAGGVLDRTLSKLPALTELNLGGCRDLSGELTAPLVGWLSSIPKKNLRGCGHLRLCADLRPLREQGATRIDLANVETLEGNLRPFSLVTTLTHLSVAYCEWITGTLAPLAALEHLEELSVAYCTRLTGSVMPLEACTKLTFLDARLCKKLTGFADLQMGGKVPGICHAGGVRT